MEAGRLNYIILVLHVVFYRRQTFGLQHGVSQMFIKILEGSNNNSSLDEANLPQFCQTRNSFEVQPACVSSMLLFLPDLSLVFLI